MKKTIKLFLCLLCAALMLCGMCTAYAQGVELRLPAQVKLKGNLPMEDETFRLVLEPVTEYAPMPEGCEERCELDFTGSGKLIFPLISYDSVGVYNYRLHQIKGNAQYYSYDDTAYILGVYVTAIPDGSLECSVVLHEENSNVKAADALFENGYYPPQTKPKTGDSGNPALWLSLCLLSLCGLTAATVLYKKYSLNSRGIA